MNKCLISLFIPLVLVISCKRKTNEERMRRTTLDVISAIEKGEYRDFKSFIGPELRILGKDESMLEDDLKEFRMLLTSSVGNSPIVNVTGLYNDLGQRIVDVVIVTKNGSVQTGSVYHLNLLFGPPNIYPLNKITGYKLTRGNLTLEGFHRVGERTKH